MTNKAPGRKGQQTAVSFRRTAMASAVALAMTPMMMQSANAQMTYSYAPTTGVLAMAGSATAIPYNDEFVINQQLASAPAISALLQGVVVLTTYTTNVPGGTPVVVSGSSATATSIGNEVNPGSAPLGMGNRNPTTIDLLLMKIDGTGSGGVLSSQIRSSVPSGTGVKNTAIQSAVTIGVRSSNQDAATMTVTDNSIASKTILNQARSVLSGDIPPDYTSARTAAITITASAALTSSVSSSVGIDSNQASVSAGGRNSSIAAVSGSEITLDLASSSTALSAGLTLSRNSIESEYTGNSGSNAIAITGGSSSLTGSLAVANVQLNNEDTGVGVRPTAYVTQSQIIADVTDRRVGLSTSLETALSVSRNTVATTSTGNSAGTRVGRSIEAGNSISIADNMEFIGNATTQSNTATVATEIATVTGDIALANAQFNNNTYFNSRTEGVNTAGDPSLQGGLVVTRADTLGTGGSVTSNRNAVTAASTGNLGGSLIAVDNSLFTGLVGANNLQQNGTTPITSLVDAGSVTVNVGNAGATPITGSITASLNTIAASSGGNIAATTVDLTSTNLESSTLGDARATADTSNFGSTSSASGASVSNMQGNYGTASVTSAVTNSFVAANTQATSLVALDALSASSVTLSTNRIESTAVANAAASVVGVGGGNATAQGTVANTQLNSNTVSGAVTNTGVLSRSGAVAGGSTITLSKNIVASGATANDGINLVGSTVDGELTLPTNGLTAAATASVVGSLATSSSALGVASSQSNTGSVSSLTSNLASPIGFATVYAGTLPSPGVSASTIVVDKNAVSSTTRGNLVNNAVDLDGGMKIASGVATAVASIASVQSNSVTGVANSTVENSGSATGVGIQSIGSLSTSTMDVTDNTVTSTTVGNGAQNQITTTGGKLKSTTPVDATGTITLAGSVNNEFSIANLQTDTVSNGRRALVTGVNVGITSNRTAVVDTTTLLVDGNQTNADARNNNAANNLTLSGYSELSSGLGLLNSQSSSTNVSADVVDSLVRITVQGAAPAIGSSSLLLTDNVVRGRATGSVAENTVSADAVTLSGNANVSAGTGVAANGDVIADYGLSNSQTQSGTTSSLVTSPLRITGTAAVYTGSTAIASDNIASSLAQGTSAVNTLSLAADSEAKNLTGVLSSRQTTTQAVTAIVRTDSSGVTPAVISIDGATFNTTPVIVTDNVIEAGAGMNVADNSQTVNGVAGVTGRGVLRGVDFITENLQIGTGTGANVTAQALPGHTGLFADVVNGGPVTVTGNQQKATADVNVATNALEMESKNGISAEGLTNNVQTATGRNTVSATVGSAVSAANFGVTANVPGAAVSITDSAVTVSDNVSEAKAGRNSATNTLKAVAPTLSGTTNPGFETRNAQTAIGAVTSATNVGTVGASTTNATGSSVTVARNRISSLSNANTASSDLTLDIDSGLTGAGLVNNNQQAVGGTIDATVTSAAVGVRGDAISGTTITVFKNVLNADATRNVGTNTLTASGDTVTGNVTAPAFRVLSNQNGAGDVTTMNSLGLIGATQTTTGRANGTTFGVVDNYAIAGSNVNVATNRLVLNALSTLTSTGEVSNTQNSGVAGPTAVTATVGGLIGTPATIGVTAFGVVPNVQTGTPVTVTGNILSAQGGGNTANNTLEAVANSSIGGGVFPVFGVLNSQNNAATVTTTVAYANIGNTVGGTATLVTTTVANNQANALSYGNSASNSLLQSALAGGLNSASSTVNNTQFNSANITATVTGVNIGMAGAGTNRGSTTVVNNSISARAVGNSATNIIGVK
ncbi:MAG: hypothetical protein V4684_05815 [Pseudomonadota bacterium]